ISLYFLILRNRRGTLQKMEYPMKFIFFGTASFLMVVNYANPLTVNSNASPIVDSSIIRGFIFDSSGSPWLDSWKYTAASKSDSAPQYFVDAPPGSIARWSICLIPGWATTSTLVHSFTNLKSGIYVLTFWAKLSRR